MDVNTITQLITNLGFPIAMVLGMAYFIWHLYKASEKREDKLMTEIAENRVTNRKAIETIAQYAERLDIIQKDVSDIKTDITIIMSKDGK